MSVLLGLILGGLGLVFGSRIGIAAFGKAISGTFPLGIISAIIGLLLL